ncbi:MAG: phytanoyl-CoA dioxygenase family protein [Armatimonadetes bacterium]|jgi:ectoine hydroxylase-related dioxygenase (phytanoyl-CoA dioxygenase family)|nr:phytanoyl-CoA dioxygenase family protein [Armatimonadota bacterium]
MSEFRLPDAQVRYYQENGFIQFNDVLTPAEVEQARASLAEAMQMRLQGGIDRTGNPEYDRIFLQKVNLWRDHPGMRAVVFHPRLAEIARQLAGVPRLRLWHDHALIKLPSDSKPSHWHQDLPYWPMNEPGALSCWLALDDVDERNGCMHFVPRSHTWGKLPPINLVEPQDIFSLVPEPEGKDFTPVPVPLRAGSCTFHHGLTFHYAPPNRGEAPRRALVIIYMPDRTSYSGAPHCVTDDLNLKPGAPLVGERFPVLARAEPPKRGCGAGEACACGRRRHAP